MPDIWSEWVLNRRFGGDPVQMKAVMDYLGPVRDRVLANARLGAGETLLDVGCGDGLIAFGALHRVLTSQVIFTDISQDLLDHAQALAEEAQLSGRCRFVPASADDLVMFPDSGVDVITIRSVLIYVSAKQHAFDEAFRVLKPGGRLSIFEPINRFRYPRPDHMYFGFDVTPVAAIARKLRAVYERLQPLDTDPMMNFDERDLLEFADRAGFRELHVELQAEITPTLPAHYTWESLLRTAANPRIPTLEEAMRDNLTSADRDAFVAHLRPLVDARQGIVQSAVAYLWATKV